jgi:hypothetical protein
MSARTAGVTVPLLVSLAVVGVGLRIVAGRRASEVVRLVPRPRTSFLRRPGTWATAAALAVYAVYSAPIVLSGSATFAGYISLDDTATWLAFADNALVHGRRTELLATYSLAHEENPFDAMAARLDRAAAEIELDPGIYRILRQPERQLTVAIPIRMDSGEIEVFTGHRVVHNTARGPGKGGIRFDTRGRLWGAAQDGLHCYEPDGTLSSRAGTVEFYRVSLAFATGPLDELNFEKAPGQRVTLHLLDPDRLLAVQAGKPNAVFVRAPDAA